MDSSKDLAGKCFLKDNLHDAETERKRLGHPEAVPVELDHIAVISARAREQSAHSSAQVTWTLHRPSSRVLKYRSSCSLRKAYLPSCDDPAQRLGSSNSLVCIAQRGMELLRASFGDLGGAIFAGLLSSFSLIPTPWWWIEEEFCVAVG
jgi:hypothetical protein